MMFCRWFITLGFNNPYQSIETALIYYRNYTILLYVTYPAITTMDVIIIDITEIAMETWDIESLFS